MTRMPTSRPLVVHSAVRALPAPLNATGAMQPPMTAPRSVNCTVPVGLSPVTVAVRVTLLPAVEGLAELASIVVVAVAAASIVCPSMFAERRLFMSPLYETLIP
jgi:hypothetical protein